MKSRKRLMKLAGLDKNAPTVDKGASEVAADDYYGMNDEVQYNDLIQGFSNLLKTSRESSEDVESIESINKRAEMLYPGKKYYGMYAGERMMESVDLIEKMKDKDIIDLSSIFNS